MTINALSSCGCTSARIPFEEVPAYVARNVEGRFSLMRRALEQSGGDYAEPPTGVTLERLDKGREDERFMLSFPVDAFEVNASTLEDEELFEIATQLNAMLGIQAHVEFSHSFEQGKTPRVNFFVYDPDLRA